MNLQETIERNITIVEEFLRDNNAPTTYDEATLEWLEQYIFERRAGWSPEEADRIILLVDSFLGECIRRTYGGEWIQTENDTVVNVKGITSRPFYSVQRVVEGEEYKSIVSFYQVLPVLLEREKKQNEDDEGR